MEVEYSRPFIKAYKKAPLYIQEAFDNRLKLFLSNSHHPFLRNHPLTGDLQGRRSFNVTGDWRTIFKETENGILLIGIGTHSQLYRT